MDRLIKIFFIIILFSTFCAKPEGFGSIKVSSIPTGARVYLDGEDTGKETNCVLDSVPAGEHTIRLVKTGYFDYEGKVTVKNDEEIELKVTLTGCYGSIRVSSIPSGAKVYLDSIYTGKTTNCILDSILCGKHIIRLTKIGYLGYEREVVVEVGKETKVNTSLTTCYGSIRVSSIPSGAKVYLDSIYTGKTTNCILDSIFPGKYRIMLTKLGYLDYVKEVTVESGEEVEVNVRLRNYYGSIKVSSSPPGAKVYLDDRYTGKTTNCTLDGISPGKRRIKLVKLCYLNYEEEVSLESGKEVEVNATLKQTTCWMQTFGGIGSDLGYSVQQTSDGGYIITGVTGSYGAGWNDVWLIKTDANGNKEWDRTFGGSEDDVGYSVEQTSDGGYIITGWTKSYGAGGYDVWLIKTDANGNKEWDRTFGGSENDYAYSVQQTTDGGYIITGETNSYGSGNSDAWLIKIDREGNKVWDRTFGGSEYDIGYSVEQTSDGGYVITGETRSYGEGGMDAWLIKTDGNGNKEWEMIFGGSEYDVGYSVGQTSDGGYIITGETRSYGSGWSDVWLIKTDGNGNKEWDRTFGGSENDYAYSVEQTYDGGYIIGGNIEDDIWFIKTDGNGNKEWEMIFGGEKKDESHSVQQTSDGGYIITGCTYSYGAGGCDIWLIKTDGGGNLK